MARMPEHWERYANLAALVTKECCVCRKGVCQATSRPCDILTPGQPQRGWRSPMSRHPHRVQMPGPFTIMNRRQLSEGLRAVEKAQEIRERSGHGDCTWFRKALLPILPGHLLDEYETLTGKGDDDDRDERTGGQGGRTLDRDDFDRPNAAPRRLSR